MIHAFELHSGTYGNMPLDCYPAAFRHRQSQAAIDKARPIDLDSAKCTVRRYLNGAEDCKPAFSPDAERAQKQKSYSIEQIDTGKKVDQQHPQIAGKLEGKPG
jgi:hypothetical protein